MGMKARNTGAPAAKGRKLRSRTWTQEGWNCKEPLARTVADLGRAMMTNPTGRKLEWGAVLGDSRDEAPRIAVRQRVTVTIEDIE